MFCWRQLGRSIHARILLLCSLQVRIYHIYVIYKMVTQIMLRTHGKKSICDYSQYNQMP